MEKQRDTIVACTGMGKKVIKYINTVTLNDSDIKFNENMNKTNMNRC